MSNLIAIPSGSNYPSWYNEKYYIDKTDQIIKVKESLKEQSALFFARPRRWGKSLFLSTIKHFFDKRLFKPEYFEDKKIWQDKDLRTKAGKYLVISLDVKSVYDRKTNTLSFENLWKDLLSQLPQYFLKKNYGFKNIENKFEQLKAISQLKSLYKNFGDGISDIIKNLSETQDIFLLIDEYDKPVNDCLKTKKNEKIAKQILENLKDDFYGYLKDIPCITLVTGVNKLSMASFFSDFNTLKDYSRFTCLGFSEEETKKIFKDMGVPYTPEIKKWYNGYYYGENHEFNPWAIIGYLEQQELKPIWARTGTAPDYFRYLVSDVLQIKTFTEYLELLKDFKYEDMPVQLDFIAEQNKSVILHYFYYAGLLSIDSNKNFFVPNNDVISSYQDFLIKDGFETELFTQIKTKLVNFLEHINDDLQYFEDFVVFLLRKKYNNLDKPTISEMNIISDVSLLIKTFSRLDLRREVNILEGRTDLEFYDYLDTKCLIEFKIVKKSENFEDKIEEATTQLKKYSEAGKYERLVYCVVDVDNIEVRCGKVEYHV